MKLHQRMAVTAIALLLFPAAFAGQTPAPAPAPAQAAPAAPRKLISPVRGEAQVEYTKPNTRVDNKSNEVITVIMVKNVSTAPIAGFKLDESWIDKAGTLSGGDTYRHPKPFMPGEVITVTLRTPKNARMASNSYNFSHANGTVKPKLVPKMVATT
jgi:hypothetical protein